MDSDQAHADIRPDERLSKESLEARVSARLHELILDGSLPLGSRIREIPLAESFGVARGTIRKALFDLMHQGLVKQRPYTGWSVVDLSSQDAWEILSLLQVLEAMAVRLAAEKVAGGASQAELDTLLSTASMTSDTEEEMHFVAAFIRFSGHARLQHHFSIVSDQYRVYRLYLQQSSNGLMPIGSPARQAPLDMSAVIEAVRAGDAGLAGELMRSLRGRDAAALKRIAESADTQKSSNFLE